MGREALDAAANAIATRAALAAVVVAAVVILPAVLAGFLDHFGRARRSAHLLRRISPPTARRIAAVVVALVAQFVKLYYVYNAQMTQLEAQRREAVNSR